MTKLLSLTLIVAGVAAAQPAPAQTLPPLPPGYTLATPSHQQAQRKDIPAIAKAANGAIVTIVMANDDKPIATGTGFLVRQDGVIVTNYHVIETGNVAVVKFSDGTALPVDGVLASDKLRDLAIIKIHGKNFRTLTLGNSDRVQIGEEVVAIGNPLGLELTVSNGILSGVRTVEKVGGKFLQITAPISHGSSGGPLFNMAGEVVGITSMYFEGGENLNFAIPVNDAKRLLLNRSAALSKLPNEPEEATPSKTETTRETEPATPLQKDISWMNHFLSKHSAHGNTYVIQNINDPIREKFKDWTVDDSTGQGDCFVSIDRTTSEFEVVLFMSFANIDPAKVEVFRDIVQFSTLHNSNKMIRAGYADGRFIEPISKTPFSNILLDSSESASGFAGIFKQMVAVCQESSEGRTTSTTAQ